MPTSKGSRITIPVPANEDTLPDDDTSYAEWATEQAAPAADQAAPARGRGRPKGSTCPRTKTVKLDVANGVRAFTDLASNTHHPGWEWSGRSYPKMKRSNGPNMDSLNRHSPVLKILIWLAPNGYPDPYKLRDVLVQLHGLFKILDPRHEGEEALSLSSVAILAADRWRIMCKHCLMLLKGKQYIPNDFVGLKECLAAFQLENPTETPRAAPADTPATSASSNEYEGSHAAWAASQAASPAASQAAPAVSWWEQPVPWKGTAGEKVTWLGQLPRATQPPPIGSTSRIGVIRYHC